jgi:hypothetical protein
MAVICRRIAGDDAFASRLNDPLFAYTPEEAVGGGMNIRADQFANHSAPGVAARAYLDVRGKSIGAASLEDICDALKRGGYDFDASSEGDAKGTSASPWGRTLRSAGCRTAPTGCWPWRQEARTARVLRVPRRARPSRAPNRRDLQGDASTPDARRVSPPAWPVTDQRMRRCRGKNAGRRR